MTAIVSIAEAMGQTKADAADTTMVQLCLDAAIAECNNYCNRNVFYDGTAMNAAIAAVPAAMVTANAAYATAVSDADAIAIEADKLVALEVADANLKRAQVAAMRDIYGIVCTPNLKAAVLMMTASFYRYREDTVIGSASAIPMNSKHIMDRHQKVGPL